MDYETELGWQDDAPCSQTDPEQFFPEQGASPRFAKKVCGGCEMKLQCLQYAVDNDIVFGVWGGLTARERRNLRRSRRLAA